MFYPLDTMNLNAGDLASDFHDFCNMNSLDKCDIKSAEYFIRELKAQKLLDEVKQDFE